MDEFVQHWLVPVLLVVPLAVGLFVVGSRLDRGGRAPVDRRTRPVDFDADTPTEPTPTPDRGRDRHRGPSRPRIEPTLH